MGPRKSKRSARKWKACAPRSFRSITARQVVLPMTPVATTRIARMTSCELLTYFLNTVYRRCVKALPRNRVALLAVDRPLAPHNIFEAGSSVQSASPDQLQCQKQCNGARRNGVHLV